MEFLHRAEYYNYGFVLGVLYGFALWYCWTLYLITHPEVAYKLLDMYRKEQYKKDKLKDKNNKDEK